MTEVSQNERPRTADTRRDPRGRSAVEGVGQVMQEGNHFAVSAVAGSGVYREQSTVGLADGPPRVPGAMVSGVARPDSQTRCALVIRRPSGGT